MSTINRVILLGNVGNVEVKEFEAGKKLIQLSLATSESYKKGDEWVEKTEWHRCIFAIPTLVDRAVSITKGDKILVEGSIKTNAWVDKDGNKKENKEISCISFKTFLKSKDSSESNGASTDSSKPASIVEDDDMPF